MLSQVRRYVLAVTAAVCLVPAAPVPRSAVAADGQPGEFYRTRVEPLLRQHCYSCHGPDSRVKGGLFLGSRKDILTGGDSGAAVDLKQPAKSLLLKAVNYDTFEMPPKQKLPAAHIAILARWVELGLPFPASAETKRPATTETPHAPQVTAEARNFWSFRRVSDPQLPAVRHRPPAGNGIDRFVQARLEAAGVVPVAAAPKQQWIRRATYDLTGLPPSMEEVEAFLADTSADAYARVIDRLLDSPHYGERWGRHWLDLVRFAESNSYERDGTKPHAWRFRDYVIRSFNEDKPYTQFVREQLAGDEFAPPTADSIIATGYYRLGVWDDEPVDPRQALYDDLDDILLTTSQVFLGLTLNCARCHDHMIDPLPQKDYYRFLAFFSGLRRYGVRSAESVEDASIGPIAQDDNTRRQAELQKALDRELIGLNRKIAGDERRLQELLTAPEKEDFRAAEVRVDLARKYIGRGLSRQRVAAYGTAVARRREIEQTRPAEIARTLVVKEIGPDPRPTHVLIRGSSSAPGELVTPGFPQVLSPPEPGIAPPASGRSSGRRTALAGWIASEHNPLTARVMVNRVWQHHFGLGLVGTPSNFGTGGARPTHPLLLDWLASRFVEGGWKLKPLHRLIMLSAAYRRSSGGSPEALRTDPANRLYWRFNRRRLSAEELRDSVLAVNGSLNRKAGGPGFYPVIPPQVLAGQSRPGNGWGTSTEEERARRAIYIFVKRSLLDPLLADFDLANADATCPVRFTTTQPTQSLGLLNSEFINRQAGVFAAYLQRETGDDPARQVQLALTRTLQRPPAPGEIARGVKLMEQLSSNGLSPAAARQAFCLLTYNLNEFLYLD